MRTLRLSVPDWDLLLDSNGNLMTHDDEPHRCAQDVASAVRTFKGECYFDITAGIPYFEEILGKVPSNSLVSAYMNRRAETVPGVAKAELTITDVTDRVLHGDIAITLDNGGKTNVTV